MSTKSGRAAIVAFALIITAQFARAQSTTSGLSGRVTDSTGAIVPGASMAVTNTDTGVNRSATSNERGTYDITLLPPGRYQITAKKPGFRPTTRSGITLQVDQVAQIDFALEVGDVSETINIVAE